MTLGESYNQSFLHTAACYVIHWVARGTYVTTNSRRCDPRVTDPWREEFLHWWNMCGAWFSASPDRLCVICSWAGPSHGSVWCLLLCRSWNQREWQTYQCRLLQSQNYWDLFQLPPQTPLDSVTELDHIQSKLVFCLKDIQGSLTRTAISSNLAHV